MLLTTSIKLLATDNQKKSLLKSMYQFNAACNWISEFAFANSMFSKVKLQKAIYYELREKFSLPSQFAIRIISRVAESYKVDKKIQHFFKKTSSVEYDQRILNWKKLDTISILSLDGRLTIPIVFGSYAKLTERVIRNSAKLVYRQGQFYLQAVVEVPEANLQETQDFLGVDLGIVNLATTSEGQSYSGKQVDNNRERYTGLKAKLQSVGTKSANRHLKKISGQEKRFKRNTNHIISKQIVSAAKALGKSIALEDLSGFKRTVRKAQRERFGKWAFGQLAAYIEYKAAIAGIEVVKVDPRNTSRTCFECGHCEKLNRKSQAVFKCRSCNFFGNADLNAAKNIAARAFVNRLIVSGQPRNKPTTLVVGH
jgi:IS605 OrfB family transposase